MINSKITSVLNKFFESKFLDWSVVIVFSLITLLLVLEPMLTPFVSDPYPLDFIADFIGLISGIIIFCPVLLLSLYLVGFCFGVRHKTRMLLFFLCLAYAIFIGYMIYEVLHMDWVM